MAWILLFHGSPYLSRQAGLSSVPRTSTPPPPPAPMRGKPLESWALFKVPFRAFLVDEGRRHSILLWSPSFLTTAEVYGGFCTLRKYSLPLATLVKPWICASAGSKQIETRHGPDLLGPVGKMEDQDPFFSSFGWL